ncbi:MAG: hypothetical protein B6D39_08760 [Anaerolineae bacterium UTCFX2]|nr:MAG: hypothetical protein B6D39_08760 [Anaerolineae bacterium UTCFX2]
MTRIKGSRLFRVMIAAALFVVSCNLLTHLPGNQPAATKTPAGEKKTDEPPTTLEPTAAPSEEAIPTEAPPFTLSQGPLFAVYSESPGEVTALIQQEKAAADLSNVRNLFLLTQSQIDRLERDGFVVTPGNEKEFFALYEKARYANLPIFVTSDALLHSYHLMFDKTLRVAEEKHFIGLLEQLNQAMLQQSDQIYQGLQNTAWEPAARRVVAYFGVASALLKPDTPIPAYAQSMVQGELALIEAAAGIQPSIIFPDLPFGEDYTQYIPRGHYTRSEALKAYFKSMMWYGRMTFRLKGADAEVGRDETRSAILLVKALAQAQVNGQPAFQAWSELYAPTVFFVGRSDDLTVVQYNDVLNYVYGANPDLNALTDEAKLDDFINYAQLLPPPKILGMVIQDTDDEEQQTKGLRFMGQRFVPDAYIFRQLIYRNVGTPDHRRGLPKGLDLMAAMGSERAYELLDQMGDTAYENYPAQMEKSRQWLANLTVPEWTETLNNAWLYSFLPLLAQPEQGYPDFMRSQAWLDKQLNTALGSWAELKHDTILYAKQVYAEMGGGPPPPPPLPPRGYVEPTPEFYARLVALTAMTRTGLESRGLLSEPDRDGLSRLEQLARACQSMAKKELRGEELTEDEYERIRFIGGELEKLVILSADMDVEEQGVGASSSIAEDQQAAVIVDVATDPDALDFGGPAALEVGVGRINEIYAIVPVVDIDGQTILQIAQGGVFSYYEFPWPAADRLTDEKWRQMLDDQSAPDLPAWSANFMVREAAFADLARAVTSFQDSVTGLFWEPQYSIDYLDAAQEQFSQEMQALNASQQYYGHQLVNSTFRSFDLESQTRAIVTARETWKDQMFTYGTDNLIGERGPYTLDVTYILEYGGDANFPNWKVVQATYANQPPAW